MSQSAIPPTFGDGSSQPSQPSPALPVAAQWPPSAPPAWWNVPPAWWTQGPPRRRAWWKRILISLVVLGLIGSLMLSASLLSLLGLGEGRGSLRTSVFREGDDNQQVALLRLGGMIDEEAVALVESFRDRIKDDSRIKAIVLRVDSGGGGVSDSDQIYDMLKDLKEGFKKKLVISMGGVAASGAYYISTPADAILAEPTTVTGSIGVIAGWPVLKGTLEKIGVNWVMVRSSNARAWKAAENPFEQPAEYQLAELRKTLDAIQARFENIVRTQRGGKVKTRVASNTYTGADGKTFTLEETEPFNGQVFLTAQAIELGLVDKEGYLEDALDEAETLANLKNPKVVEYSRRHGILTQMGLNQSAPPLSVKALDEIQTPRIMMVWRVGN